MFEVILEYTVNSMPASGYETLSQSKNKTKLAATKHLNLVFYLVVSWGTGILRHFCWVCSAD